MNKSEIIDAIAKGAGISKAEAKKALDAFIEATSDALKEGDRVALVGFGSFAVISRKKRRGRNPHTGKIFNIPAKRVVTFKPSLDLKEDIEEGIEEGTEDVGPGRR